MKILQSLTLASHKHRVYRILFLWLPFIIIGIVFIFKDQYLIYSGNKLRNKQDIRVRIETKKMVDDKFNYALNGEKYKYTLIKFKSEYCKTCNRLKHETEQIKNKYPNEVKIQLFDINYPENKRYLDYFGIVSIPTQIILDRSANEISRHFGFIAAPKLEKQFTTIFY